MHSRTQSCVLGLAAAMALAGGAAVARPGPDLIVGELDGVLSYTPPADDPQAYSVGTVSCNIGDDVVQWVDFTNQHPVIATNMYRLVPVAGAGSARRLEQIGQSWLKHGFLALGDSYCSVCPPGSPSGSVLGVGCSDPYDAFLNGQQSWLGPRSEVNPSTGVFPYPISWAAFPDRTGDGVGDQPLWSGPVSRRIRVARSDMLAQGAGGLYFVEGQYVTQDDAAAGNKHNNASYRRITVNPSTLEVALADTTQRTRPAIFAWRDHGLGANVPDAAVTLVPVDVPSDGRFWIGARVTQVSAGVWHYEYAVQNLNSDRGAYSFGVTAAGPSISNPGFHDVNPHSGEIWDGTDWGGPLPGVQSSGFARWSAIQTPTANPRGNALRWGTLYNFWFDANAAPATGQATIVLFKGGTGSPNEPLAVRAAVPTPGGLGNGSALAPSNDACATGPAIGAAPVGRGEFAFSTQGATESGPAECAGAGGAGIVKDVWFRYVHDGIAGMMTVSTCGSGFDTKIAVYAGSACPATGGTAIACNDDATGAAPAGCGPGSTSSLVSFPVTPGQAYLIRVGGSPGASALNQSGNGLLRLDPPPPPTGACCRTDGSCVVSQPVACNASYGGDGSVCSPNPCPQPPPPANDLCADARWIADGVPITATNAYANTDATVNACANGGVQDVWFKYRPAVSGPVDITTDNSVVAGGAAGGSTDFDTNLALYTACGGSLLDCDDDSGTSPELSSHIFGAMLTAGQTYVIRVAGYPYSDPMLRNGVFTLKVIGGGGTIPVPGACCTGTACAVVGDAAACAGGSVFQGGGTACGPAGNPTTCCPANFNGVGGVSVQDIFDFLAAYFTGSPAADVNRSGMVTVQDVFDYLVMYFTGC